MSYICAASSAVPTPLTPPIPKKSHHTPPYLTAGTGEVNAATAKAHMEATGTKVQGTVEKVIGTVTGDKVKQAQGDAHKAQGDIQHKAA
jgi:uncharacterized protein YjbJ (UPF0337 family)